jgi:uridylate kinase
MPTKPHYQRVLLQTRRECLLERANTASIPKPPLEVAQEIKSLSETGTQVAVSLGAGNLFRGISGAANGIDRATADYMGMLATVMNALALQDAVEKIGVASRVLSGLDMPAVAEPYIRRRAIRHLDKGRVVILAGGSGNPYFTTDTSAALRALEMGCEVILKATKVDGIYDKDPTNIQVPKNIKSSPTWTPLKNASKSWTPRLLPSAWTTTFRSWSSTSSKKATRNAP